MVTVIVVLNHLDCSQNSHIKFYSSCLNSEVSPASLLGKIVVKLKIDYNLDEPFLQSNFHQKQAGSLLLLEEEAFKNND
jgi:hypothetical protein